MADAFNVETFVREINDTYRDIKAEKNIVVSSVPSTIGPPKSAERAELYNNIGCEALIQRHQGGHEKRLKIVEYHTRSLALSPENSEEQAQAYANRSVILAELGYLKLSLYDINRALKGKYPNKWRETLQTRKNLCLNTIRSTMHNVTIEGDETESDDDNIAACKPSIKWAENFDNPLIPHTTRKIRLQFDDKVWGRHMVATKNISAGEILSCEKFYSFGVLPDGSYSYNHETQETRLSIWQYDGIKHYRNCSHCGIRCSALIPCSSCTLMMYCSKKCRAAAQYSYHRTECKMGNLYGNSDWVSAQPYFLAVRTLLIGTKQGSVLGKLMKNLTIEKIFEGNLDLTKEPPNVNKYLCILRLAQNYDMEYMREKMEHAVQAVIILRSLGFFEGVPEFQTEEVDSDQLNDAELFVAALLLNHFATQRYYAYQEPKKTIFDAKNNASFIKDPVIEGTLLFHALINHSCDPNASDFVRQQEHVLFATRSIKRGEQIFVSYGVFFKNEDKLQRSKQLPFSCHCQACTDKWLTYGICLAVEQAKKTTIHEACPKLLRMSTQFLKSEINDVEAFEVLKLIIEVVTVFNNKIQDRSFYLTHIIEDFIPLFTKMMYDDVNERANWARYPNWIRGLKTDNIIRNLVEGITKTILQTTKSETKTTEYLVNYVVIMILKFEAYLYNCYSMVSATDESH